MNAIRPHASFPEEEFLSLGDDLRPFTERAMKIEVAPWIQGYEINMEDLYTELTITEEIKYKPAGPEVNVLSNYREIFENSSYEVTDKDAKIHNHTSAHASGKTKTHRHGKLGKKLLIKGDPGVGKSTLSKKIPWDWARGNLFGFTIVFFVFMKFIRPGDAIEDIIIKQHPVLEGLNISKEKLRYILDSRGDRILLILDGLDQHELGSNDDIEKIITGRELLQCNLLVTSRPHCTRDIERYFSGIFVVMGFNRKRTIEFMSKLLMSETQDVERLSFEHLCHTPDYTNPMIIAFICLLAREKGTVHLPLGEIFLPLIT